MAWDDAVLVVLLLVIAVPRVVLAIVAERPVGAEGAMSILAVLLALILVLRRTLVRRPRRS